MRELRQRLGSQGHGRKIHGGMYPAFGAGSAVIGITTTRLDTPVTGRGGRGNGQHTQQGPVVRARDAAGAKPPSWAAPLAEYELSQNARETRLTDGSQLHGARREGGTAAPSAPWQDEGQANRSLGSGPVGASSHLCVTLDPVQHLAFAPPTVLVRIAELSPMLLGFGRCWEPPGYCLPRQEEGRGILVCKHDRGRLRGCLQ